MSNEVWVTWKGAAGEPMVDTVDELPGDAQIKNLRKKFVKQQNLNVGPATVSVFETEGGEKLKASDPLQPYFARPKGSGPGQSEDTALLVTFPLDLPSGKLSVVFVFLYSNVASNTEIISFEYEICSDSCIGDLSKTSSVAVEFCFLNDASVFTFILYH